MGGAHWLIVIWIFSGLHGTTAVLEKIWMQSLVKCEAYAEEINARNRRGKYFKTGLIVHKYADCVLIERKPPR